MLGVHFERGVLVKFTYTRHVCLLVAAHTLAAPSALAQGFSLERLPNVTQATDGFATNRLLGFGAKRWGLSVVTDYANDPLVVTLSRPSNSETAIVGDWVASHVAVSGGFGDRVVLFLGADVPFYIDGDQPPALRGTIPFSDGGGMGDVWFGGKVLVAGKEGSPFALGAQLNVSAPTSGLDEGQTFRGEESLTAFPQLIGELRFPGLRIDANLGVLFRQSTELRDITLGHDFRYAVGAGIPVHDRVELFGEVFGTSPLTDFADDEGVNVEWLVGPKINTKSGFVGGVAGGTGLTSGIGTPDYRMILSLAFQSPRVETPPPPAPLVDPNDLCPTEDEDVDGFRDDDGCADLDNDADAVPDTRDACPLEVEDPDGIQDEDGCPEAAGPVVDSDGDGVQDPNDQCVQEQEDIDQFHDEDGCPELDNDGDGVTDVEDKCPLEPGVRDEAGCPKSVRVSETEIQILQQIQFATNKAVILEESYPLMNELVGVFNAMPNIKRVRVEGHTDDRGGDKMNLGLSQRRAASVVQWLVDHGVAKERLEAWGCGETTPLQPNTTPEGRAANRRVVFHIVDPKPPAQDLAGTCREAPPGVGAGR